MSWERVKPLSENRRIRIMAHDFRTVAESRAGRRPDGRAVGDGKGNG